MEENNKETVENVSYSYEPIGNMSEKKSKSNIGRTFIVPFLSGVVGAGVVIGTCFFVPPIKNLLIGTSNSALSDQLSSESNTSNYINTSFISLKDYSDTGVYVAEKVLPSVVGIKVEYSVNSIFGRGTSTASAEGSGIIISQDGYILTNNHIVDTSSSSSFYEVSSANKVSVYLYNDETAYEGTIVGTDEQTDLAVIKIDKDGLTAAELGDSSTVKVGEFTMAIGNPLGMQSSVSTGTISAVNRTVTSNGKTFTLIQTDAAINSGNSGGALVNSEGKVIGINTLKMSGTGVEGMGFAIPINSTIEIYDQLIKYNKVKRPYIGITGKDLSENLAKANNLEVGIYITDIADFSAAEKAGLKIGDVIVEADGKSITTMKELTEIKDSHQIGDELKIKFYRNGNLKETTLTLQEQ